MFTPRRAVSAGIVALSAALVTGCGTGGAGSQESPGGRMGVTVAFYPLQYAVERIGGDSVHVMTLTKPGAEPHDVELTAPQLVALTKARVVVYEHGFQAAVDDAVARTGPGVALDIDPAADLSLTAQGEEGGGTDPHFWLDPVRYAVVVKAIGADLAAKDPANASAYAQGTAALVADLTRLDTDFATGLRTCRVRDLVTGHAAFGYLSQRYGFTQLAIAGVSPDVEPDAAAMREIVATVRKHKVPTVYAETLVSPALADTIGRETGASVRVLDPVEGITTESAGTTYLEVMRANLATLRAGQECG